MTSYPALDMQVIRKTLPSGLQICVVPMPGFTKKLAYLMTDFGAIHTNYSLQGQQKTLPAGIAHYLEHKLFDMPENRDITAEFAALGASVNAFTSYDMTAYHFSCTEHFRENLSLLLEFVTLPYFTPQSVEKEQGIIAQEIGMNLDAPDMRVFENLMQILYKNHPIRVPILGTVDSISQITAQVLTDCHSAFYRPENMFLCVLGDVDAEEVAALAEKYFPEKHTPVPVRVDRWQEDMACVRPKIEETMEVSMPMFQLGFKCEPLPQGQAAMRREIVGELAAEWLFGESSELYLRLYEEGLIDSSFGGGYETVENMAMLTCSGDSKDPEAVQEAILRQVQKLLREGLEDGDFLRMKRSAMGRRIRGLDSFDSTAFRLCAYHTMGVDYFCFPEAYQAVEKEELKAFLEQTVTRERMALSVIHPCKED